MEIYISNIYSILKTSDKKLLKALGKNIVVKLRDMNLPLHIERVIGTVQINFSTLPTVSLVQAYYIAYWKI